MRKEIDLIVYIKYFGPKAAQLVSAAKDHSGTELRTLILGDLSSDALKFPQPPVGSIIITPGTEDTVQFGWRTQGHSVCRSVGTYCTEA